MFINLTSYIANLVIPLTLTLLIEFIPIVVFLGIKPKYFIAVNVLTNVFANSIVYIFDICSVHNLGLVSELPFDRLKLIFIIEILVVISEIILYYLCLGKKKIFKTIVLTIIANLLSYFLGNYIISLI